MVVGRRSCIVFQKQMQVADLVKQNRAVDDAWTVNLIELLNRVVFFQVEAEHCV